jgi:hypothetical protein
MFSKLFGKSKSLPDCDELFLKYFDPWYDNDSRNRKGFEATRPDMMQVPELIGLTSEQACPLQDSTRLDVARQVEVMLDSARADFSTFLPVSGDPDFSWVDAYDQHFDRKHIQELLDTSDPTEFSNDYVVTCCEFGALLGYVHKKATPRLQWYYEHPYWESALFDPETGLIVPPFHFAVKKMSEYGVEDGMVAKLNHLAAVLEEEIGEQDVHGNTH